MKIERKRLQTQIIGSSRTKQAFKDDCDINKIISRYQKTQLLTHVNRVKGSYGDFSNVADYQSALNAVMSAQEKFMELPAQVRSLFQNNPAAIIEFLSDDKNYEQAAKMGLLDEEKAKAYQQSKNPPVTQEEKKVL